MPGKPDTQSGFWLSLLMTEDHRWAGDKRLIPPDGKGVSALEATRFDRSRKAAGSSFTVVLSFVVVADRTHVRF